MKFAIMGLIFCSRLYLAAQPVRPEQPAFEVASLRPAPELSDAPSRGARPRIGARGGPGTDDPGLFTCNYCNLWLLMLQAYDLPPYRITGQVSQNNMMDRERFNVTAKVPEGTTREQFRLMLQTLLTERFQMKTHPEKKDVTGYELIAGKGALKLKVHDPNAAKPEGPPPPAKWTADGALQMPVGYGTRSMIRVGPNGLVTNYHAEGETMDRLADMIARSIDAPVRNATGLTEKYDFELTWARNQAMPGLGAPPSASAASGNAPLDSLPDRDMGPTIFSAVQSQLGLKLEKKFVATEFLVVDHYEKMPTEN